jgi:hypothetical protein
MWPSLDAVWQDLKDAVEAFISHQRVYVGVAVVALAAGMAGSVLWPALFTVPVVLVLWRDIQAELQHILACIREIDAVELPLAGLRKRRTLLEAKLAAAECRLQTATLAATALDAQLQDLTKVSGEETDASEKVASEASAALSQSSKMARAAKHARKPRHLSSLHALQRVELGHLRQSCEALALCIQAAHRGHLETPQETAPAQVAPETVSSEGLHKESDAEGSETQHWPSSLTDVVAQEAILGPLIALHRNNEGPSPSVSPTLPIMDTSFSPGAFDMPLEDTGASPPTAPHIHGPTTPLSMPVKAVGADSDPELELDHIPSEQQFDLVPSDPPILQPPRSPALAQSAAWKKETSVAQRMAVSPSRNRLDVRGFVPGPMIESHEVTQQCSLQPQVGRSQSSDSGDPDLGSRTSSEAFSSYLESIPQWRESIPQLGETLQGAVDTLKSSSLESFKGAVSRHFSFSGSKQ